MSREDYISDLRAAADFFEQHPEIEVLPAPYLFATVYTHDGVDPKEVLRAVIKAARQVKKVFTQNEAQIEIHFPGGLMLRYDVPRDSVCERVVVGTRTIPAQTFKERVEEVVEWRCHPMLDEVAS